MEQISPEEHDTEFDLLTLAACANKFVSALAEFMTPGEGDGTRLERAVGRLCEEAESYA